MFGTAPRLGIDDDFKFQTKFGSFLSVLLFFIICAAMWIYGNDIIYK